MSDVELEEIKGSPYLTIAYERGLKEGREQGAVEELKRIKVELNNRVLESMWSNSDRISLIGEFIEKRLSELEK